MFRRGGLVTYRRLGLQAALDLESVTLFFFFFTLVTGPRRSLSLELSDTKSVGLKYEPASEPLQSVTTLGSR